MPNERVVHANQFAKNKHPGIIGIEVLSCEPDLVTGRLVVTRPLVAGTGFLWAPVVITLADWLCSVGTGANLAAGESFTTIELKTNFIGTVREGGSIFGEATPGTPWPHNARVGCGSHGRSKSQNHRALPLHPDGAPHTWLNRDGRVTQGGELSVALIDDLPAGSLVPVPSPRRDHC